MSQYLYDLFICHATEDKQAIAGPLAQGLKEFGKRVWFDDYELVMGDSLSGKINEGLRKSRFGVIVISQAFLDKGGWSKKEFEGLLALEANGRRRILPIWHGVTYDTILEKLPILADRKAFMSSVGIQTLVNEILRAIDDDSSEVVTPFMSETTEWRRECIKRAERLGLASYLQIVFSPGGVIEKLERRELRDAIMNALGGTINPIGFPILYWSYDGSKRARSSHFGLEAFIDEASPMQYWSISTTGDIFIRESLVLEDRDRDLDPRRLYPQTRIIRLVEGLILAREFYNAMQLDENTMISVDTEHHGINGRILSDPLNDHMQLPILGCEDQCYENFAKSKSKISVQYLSVLAKT